MKKKKIAIFMFSMGGGGIQKFVMNLIGKLNKDKYDVSIILVNKKGVYLNHIPSKVEIIDLGVKRVYFSLIPLIKVITNIRPDIIFSIGTNLNIIAVLAKLISRSKSKLIVRQAVEFNDLSTKKITLILTKLLYPRVDKCIVLTHTMKKNLINTIGLDEKKIEVIYNSIDIEIISKKKKEKIEENIFNKIVEPKIIAIGRLTIQKNYLMLLDAFELVLKEKNVKLIIMGEGEEKSKIEETIKIKNMENNVELLGFKNNPYKYIYNSDVFVLSSLYEGLSNALLESLACNIPVVTTNNPDNIIVDEVNGFYADLNPKDIANKLIELLGNEPLRNSIIKNNNKYSAKFDISNMVKKYELLFSEI